MSGDAVADPWLADGDMPTRKLDRELLESRILNLLSTHNMCVVAKTGDSGPLATPVRYFHLGFAMFTASPKSPKMQDIAADARASVGLHAPLVSLASSRGAQVFGNAIAMRHGDPQFDHYWDAFRWNSEQIEQARSPDDDPGARVAVEAERIVYTEHWLRRDGYAARQFGPGLSGHRSGSAEQGWDRLFQELDQLSVHKAVVVGDVEYVDGLVLDRPGEVGSQPISMLGFHHEDHVRPGDVGQTDAASRFRARAGGTDGEVGTGREHLLGGWTAPPVPTTYGQQVRGHVAGARLPVSGCRLVRQYSVPDGSDITVQNRFSATAETPSRSCARVLASTSSHARSR